MRRSAYFAGVVVLAVSLGVLPGSCGKGAESDSDSVARPEQELAEENQVAGQRTVSIPQGPRYHDHVRVNNVGKLWEVFNDSNKYQYAYAERIGIEPVTSLRQAYFARRPLVAVATCEEYYVDSLTHSIAYLVPEAADLLKTIGRNFIDSLYMRGGDGYKIKVTSLLRTPSHVKRLRRVNRNATDSSTHQFGTTFDLSWSKFYCADSTRTLDEGDLKNLLAEVLLDMRKQGKCLVKYERKTCCFHITATGK